MVINFIIGLIMGFPLIDRVAMKNWPGVRRQIFAIRQVIPAGSAVVHLVESNSKTAAVHGNKFRLAAIILWWRSSCGAAHGRAGTVSENESSLFRNPSAGAPAPSRPAEAWLLI
jgi:hypothetical protein